MLRNFAGFPPLERFSIKPRASGRRAAWGRRFLALAIVLGMGVNLLVLILFPPAALVRHLPDRSGAALRRARLAVYGAWVDLQRDWALSRLPSYYKKLDAPPFVLYFPPGGEDEARAVARVAARHLGPLERDLGVRAAAPVPVVISPTARDLAGVLNGRRSVLGAYWQGVVWVLSPRQWLDVDSGDWVREFEVQGPMVHELAHSLLDRKTVGNLPAWFDEGLAQYMEFTRTGYQWVEPANRLDQPLYSLETLTAHFGRLPNEALAYRQAFLLVRALAETNGPDVLRRITGELSRGVDVNTAIRTATGEDLAALLPLAWQETPAGRRTGS